MPKHSYKVFGASPFGDISFIVKNTHLNGSIMLDCGNISYYNNTQVGDITHLLISHTHMDHFYGFDRIIRSMLISNKKLIIFGPTGIIQNVHCRTQSYTWNLVDNYEFALEVHELGETGVDKSALLPANKGFEPHEIPCNYVVDGAAGAGAGAAGAAGGGENNAKPTLALNNGFTMTYEIFDHAIPSVGYRISSPRRVNISEKEMATMGLKGGIWVRELKHAYLQNTPETEITPEYRPRPDDDSNNNNSNSNNSSAPKASVAAYELFYMLTESASEVITFITDIAPTSTNITKATDLAKNSHILLIEGVFMEEDREQAKIKKHLTIPIAKGIFGDSQSGQLHLFHHSPRYEIFKGKLNHHIRKGIEDRILTLSHRDEY